MPPLCLLSTFAGSFRACCCCFPCISFEVLQPLPTLVQVFLQSEFETPARLHWVSCSSLRKGELDCPSRLFTHTHTHTISLSLCLSISLCVSHMISLLGLDPIVDGSSVPLLCVHRWSASRFYSARFPWFRPPCDYNRCQSPAISGSALGPPNTPSFFA